MYKVLAIINVELGLRIRNRPNSPVTSKVCRDSQAFYIRLLRTRKRARVWIIFKVLRADRLEAYDAEMKRSLVRSDVAVLVLFCCALY